MSSQQRKRLRKNIAASSISDASEPSDAEVEQINVFPNSPEDESAEEKEGDAPPAPVPTHIMWIQRLSAGFFSRCLQKVLKMITLWIAV